MLVLSKYQIIEEIHSGVATVIYRAYDQIEQRPIIFKVLKAEYPTLAEFTRLRHEYTIMQNLDREDIIKVYNLENYHNGLALILEDFGGQSLDRILSNRRLPLTQVLRIGIALADSLNYLHQIPIIHKDIKPSNIIINPVTGQIKIADFSIASRLDSENPTISNPNQLSGTLAYMSPEQTGRMNRVVDYRSDFYCLGITLYEMLTGQLPFTSTDFLELVYCHIAKQPIPPADLTPPTPLPFKGRGENEKDLSPFLLKDGLGEWSAKIPQVVSDIVMKLIAKTAEERYQSALGLKYDLEFCLQQLETVGFIDNFIVGERDKSAQLLIPQKLYGRETEISTLLEAFERVGGNEINEINSRRELGNESQNPKSKSELLLVSGYSGIGKTSVINEVHKPIIEAKGYFIAGKFDQFKRNIPYTGLIQAFQDLISQILTLNQPEIEIFQHQLQTVLGQNGQIIIDVIPEVELIIGFQPPPPELGPTESQNRFNRVFQQFISVFCQPEHPLVLFLDDLQWADSASLKLIQLLMTDADSQYLLTIGAYRDNEVSPTHPLIQTINKIQEAGTIVNNITLKPLSLHQVSLLVADTLGEGERGSAQTDMGGLSQLLFNKTQGNPFFLTTLLKTLYAEKLISYHISRGKWQWDIQAIQAVGIIDSNVVELIARNIQKLPSDTVKILQLAACIGNQFNLEVLAIVNEASETETARYLWDALLAGLILPLNDAYKIPMLFGQEESATLQLCDVKIDYKFLHDRVQQAAYSLIPTSEKKATHFKIGQLLLANTTPETRQENIFALVNQLNYGIELIAHRWEKDELAELNLIAGQKAKAATAYEAAVNYLNVGMELLPADSWQSNYDLTLNLYIETLEAEYFNLNFDRAETLSEQVLEQANSLLDKIKVYERKIQFYTSQTKMQLAIDTALPVLEMLEVSLESAPPQGIIIEDLINLPLMKDPYKLAAMRILNAVINAAYIANPGLLLPVIFTMIYLSVKFGNSLLSTYGYVLYGLILCGGIRDINSGYKFGQLSVGLLEKMNIIGFKYKVLNVFNGYIRYWKEHTKETIEPLFDGIQSGLETGDIENASIAAINHCYHWFVVGDHLESVIKKYKQYLSLMIKLDQKYSSIYQQAAMQMVLNLIIDNSPKDSLTGEAFDENEMLPILKETKNATSLFCAYCAKTLLSYLFKNYTQAVESGTLAEQYIQSSTGLITVTQHNFYYSLALLAQYPNANEQEQPEYLAKVESNQEKMKLWASHAPCNFQHKYDLIEAEKARIFGQIAEAISLYDKAILGASEQGYIQEEALANELAAEFHFARQNQKIAQFYLTEAYYGYIRWGAKAKVTDLQSRYPNLIQKLLIRNNPTLDSKNTTILTTNSNSEILDIGTAMKASQAISSEIVLPKLLEKLTKIAIENVGAEKGLLLLNEANSLVIETCGKVDKDNVTVEAFTSQELDPAVPLGIVNYVQRTRRSLVLNDARNDSAFNQDPYIVKNQPLSVLCMPMLDRGKLIGLFYLENNFIEGAFTSQRLEILKMLASQAAISIENASLVNNLSQTTTQLQQANQQLEDYSRTLEAKVQERTQELQIKEARLTEAQKLANLGNWEIDLTTKELIWSDEIFPIFGIDPADGVPSLATHSQQIHPDDLQLWQTMMNCAIESGQPYEFDVRILRPDGSTRYLFVKGQSTLDSSGQPIKLFGTAQDITERKSVEEALRLSEAQLREQANQLQTTLRQLQKTQSQLIQTEKMSSLGQLIAGIAHEINNPINFIYGNISYVEDYAQRLLGLIATYQKAYPNPTEEVADQADAIELDYLQEDLPKLLESMQSGADRIRQIVLSLRNFSRLDESSTKPVDIHEGIESTLMLLQPRLKAEGQQLEIQVIKEYGQLPKITCYASEMNQVFMNILSNAIDALETARNPQPNTGELPTIKITTELCDRKAIIKITDNGTGIPETVRAKIFDPFFTTKPVGSGTGLGLSIGYQIVVEKHRGELTCTSVVGEGTTFAIVIPIVFNQQKSALS